MFVAGTRREFVNNHYRKWGAVETGFFFYASGNIAEISPETQRKFDHTSYTLT